MQMRKLPLKFFETKRFYFRVFVPFMILIVLTLVSSSLIFSNIYLKTLYKQLMNDSMHSIESLNNEFDNLFYQLFQTNISLNQYIEIDTFLHDKNPDGLSIIRANKHLGLMVNTNSFIHSIVLYNKDADYPLIGGKINLDLNAILSGNLSRPDLQNTLFLVYSSLKPENIPDQYTETISMIHSNSWNQDGTFDDAVIFTLNKTEIVKKMLNKLDGTSFVVDNYGKIAFCSSTYSGINFIHDEDYFVKILASGERRGNFTGIVDRENVIITYTKGTESDFYIVNIRSYDDIAKPIMDTRNVFVVICSACSLLLCLLTYFIAMFVYSPIKKITALFKQTKYLRSESGLDEVSIISKVFKESQIYIENLEINTQDNNKIITENFLRELLVMNKPLEPDNQLQMNTAFDNLIFVSIRVDNYNALGKHEKSVYTTTLCRTIPELLKDNFISDTVNMFEGEIALLLNYVNVHENNFDMLLQSMENLKSTIRENLNITISIGIGGVSNSIDKCFEAYKKAVNMVKHRFVLGTDQIIYPRYVDESLTTDNDYPYEMEDKLIMSIKANKKDSFVTNLDNIFEMIKSYTYPEAVSVFFQITTSCIKAINQITTQDRRKFYLNFDELSSIFASLQTVDQAKNWLLGIFNEYQAMLESIKQLKNNKHYIVVEKMQNYIRQNYNNLNLSVESMADSVGYSAYYFSGIFKEITGTNVSDYIRQTRIDKAKEFLGNDEFKINQIPEMVGFTNISHFYSVFKKGVGLTPAAYREYIKTNCQCPKSCAASEPDALVDAVSYDDLAI